MKAAKEGLIRVFCAIRLETAPAMGNLPSSDGRHRQKYSKSQTPARVAKENRAHNGSKRREAKV